MGTDKCIFYMNVNDIHYFVVYFMTLKLCFGLVCFYVDVCTENFVFVDIVCLL